MKPIVGIVVGASVVAGLVAAIAVNELIVDRAVRRGPGAGRGRGGGLQTYVYHPIGIMGTQTMLKAVVPRGDPERANAALRRAERALRDVEAKMSSWIESTEVSRLNAAPPGRPVPLSGETLALLTLSRDLAGRTGGAFDVTCRPLVQLWKQAGRRKRLPSAAEIDAARSRCGWDKLRLLAGAARKTVAGAGVDLGGVAKGCAIDRAVEALRRGGAAGGIVDVGGDVRCFGRRPAGGKWTVGVRDPFRTDKMFVYLAAGEGAVCTSGNYFRFTEIDGRRYSHIIDPRTGRSAQAAPSVTVFARSATLADAWATALSVLGPPGLRRLPRAAGLEAMIVAGKPGAFSVHMTRGFHGLLVGRPEWEPVIVSRPPTSRPATAPANLNRR